MSNSLRQWHSFGSTDNLGGNPCTTDAKVFDNDAWEMTENIALNSKGNGSDVSVIPDGSSTGTDIGNSTTLKVWAQKFKNLVASLTSDYLTKTGDASNTTSSFTKASGDTSSMTSGRELSAIFTAISSFFASLKALAFKDSVGASDIGDDAITAAKVKDNETLPVNISGTARGQYVPRSNGNLNDQYSKYDFNVVEYQNTASNRPTPNGWYFGLAMCGGDSDFGAQIALGMTIDRIFWRNKRNGTPSSWMEIPSFAGTTGVGSETQPVYVDSEGSVMPCTNVNADTVDGKHIVVGTLGSAANTIYFLDGT
jgi:hypothetical protein